MVRLLDLSEDALATTIACVMTPPKEGPRRIVTEEAIRKSLQIALSCCTQYATRRCSMHDLELWFAGRLNDSGLLAVFLGNGSRIHRLDLRKYNLLTSRALDALSIICPSLRSLDVSYLGDRQTAGASLHSLVLQGCSSLTLRRLPALADRCTTLRFLDFRAVPAADNDALDLITTHIPILSQRVEVSNVSSALR